MTRPTRCAAAVLACAVAACRTPDPGSPPPAATSDLVVEDPAVARGAVVELGGVEFGVTAHVVAQGVRLEFRSLPRPAPAGPCAAVSEDPAATSRITMDEPILRVRFRLATATLRLEGARGALEVRRAPDLDAVLLTAGPGAGIPTIEARRCVLMQDEAFERTWLVSPSVEPAAALRARGLDGAGLRHRAAWRRWWSTSRVLLPDADLQARYDRARYVVSARRAPSVARAVVGLEPRGADLGEFPGEPPAALARAEAALRKGRAGAVVRALRAAPDPLGDPCVAEHTAQVVHRMLLGGAGGVLELFPVVPDAWAAVAFEDLRTPAGHRVSAEWRDGQVRSFALVAARRGVVRLRDPFGGAVAYWNGPVTKVGDAYEIWLEHGEELKGSRIVGAPW